MAMKEKRYLTSNDVATLLRVSPVTVRQWAQKGRLKADCTPGGHRRFNVDDIETFAHQHGISLHDPDSGFRVLIVDDDQQVVRYLGELLMEFDEDIELAFANDGFEAGRLVSTFHPNAILLDLMMPGMNGFEVCRTLKSDEATRGIRIIAMTGYANNENINQILEAGAESCLGKPLRENEIFAALGLSEQLKLQKVR